jgi:hypothetical protein
MAATTAQALANFERNIEVTTGLSVEGWVALIRAGPHTKHGQMVAWMKAHHGLAHSHANHIAKAATAIGPSADGDPVAHLFEGDKAALRPLYDAVVAAAIACGADVEIAPKKNNVSVRRAKQFALIQPTTKTRVDLGLILKGREPAGRLEASGSFNAMFTHRVKLSGVAELDDEVRGWLREAYGEAG